MKFSKQTLTATLLLAGSVTVSSFLSPIGQQHGTNKETTYNTCTASQLQASFLDNLPNPFQEPQATTPRPPSTPPPVSNEPEALFSRARAIIASDFGLADPSFLSQDFQWVGPDSVKDGTLSKEEYLAASNFFNLRNAFPDLDYRAHDFRLDPDDPFTVRLTARTVGTMRGELRLRSENLEPTGVRMVCPPEAISMTFDETSGKLKKLCSGFTMDRLVGNTGGLCGVKAAATVAGAPPSEWEVYPPAVVIGRFFGRSVKQLKEPESVFLAPFPETVMIQLAKGVLAGELGTKDPDLLAEEFTFTGPVVGPLSKKQFLDAFSSFNIREALPDLQENYSNFRVDPYDPYRVWYDVKSTGTRTGPLAGQEGNGAKYIGPPEVQSMTFDDDGFCTRLTAGAVMDPTYGNTGGLGGVFGIFYATGVPLPALSTRSLPEILSRVQKSILSPISGKPIDEFGVVETSVEESKPVAPPEPVTKIVETPPKPVAEVAPPVKNVAPPKPVPPPMPPKEERFVPKPKPPPAPVAKKVEPKAVKKDIPILDDPADPVTDVFTNLFGGKSENKDVAPKTKEPEKKASPPKTNVVAEQKAALKAAAEKRKKEAEEKKAALAEKKRLEAEQKKAALEAKKKEAEEKRLAAIAANEAKKKEAMEKKAAAAKETEALGLLEKAKRGATISLGFLNFGGGNSDSSATPSSKAPRGVPTLSKWYQNNDGSITGLISGSSSFSDGESVTTSSIQGKPVVDTVVSTASGSKYYLDSTTGNKPFFNFGGSKKADPVPAAPAKNTAVDAKKAAAEAKKIAAEEKKAKLEAAKKAKEEELARKKAELEAKKAKLAEEKKAALEKKKQEAEEKRLAAQQKKAAPVSKKVDPKATSILAGAKKGGTIPLKKEEPKSGGLFAFGGSAQKKKTASTPQPPKGVPVINKFKANRDGSVTGFITGSPNFSEGERVTTSKLAPNQTVEAGVVVTTVSGSKYFLL